MFNVYDQAELLEHESIAAASNSASGEVRALVRLSMTLAKVGRVVVLVYDAEADELEVRALPDEIDD